MNLAKSEKETLKLLLKNSKATDSDTASKLKISGADVGKKEEDYNK
ncbi:MAG TPA: hypothetical protein VJ438_02650 [Candidatus Nanoarchaeia archaeon]|nr:hypothetical protein [Candidatus Nanoarchaeia archaeon]